MSKRDEFICNSCDKILGGPVELLDCNFHSVHDTCFVQGMTCKTCNDIPIPIEPQKPKKCFQCKKKIDSKDFEIDFHEGCYEKWFEKKKGKRKTVSFMSWGINFAGRAFFQFTANSIRIFRSLRKMILINDRSKMKYLGILKNYFDSKDKDQNVLGLDVIPERQLNLMSMTSIILEILGDKGEHFEQLLGEERIINRYSPAENPEILNKDLSQVGGNPMYLGAYLVKNGIRSRTSENLLRERHIPTYNFDYSTKLVNYIEPESAGRFHLTAYLEARFNLLQQNLHQRPLASEEMLERTPLLCVYCGQDRRIVNCYCFSKITVQYWEDDHKGMVLNPIADLYPIERISCLICFDDICNRTTITIHRDTTTPHIFHFICLTRNLSASFNQLRASMQNDNLTDFEITTLALRCPVCRRPRQGPYI